MVTSLRVENLSPEKEAAMIRCVKDLSLELPSDDPQPVKRRYRFLDHGLEIRSNSPAPADLADAI